MVREKRAPSRGLRGSLVLHVQGSGYDPRRSVGRSGSWPDEEGRHDGDGACVGPEVRAHADRVRPRGREAARGHVWMPESGFPGLWLLPGKGREAVGQRELPSAQRAGAGDCVGLSREREGPSRARRVLGTAESARSPAGLPVESVPVVNGSPDLRISVKVERN